MTIVHKLEGINGGQKFELHPFPINDIGLQNGTILVPTSDRPWFGLKAGQKFSINWDGEYVRAGELTWSVEQLLEEIENGLWQPAA